MIFEPPLHSAILIRRYKRFLADVRLPDGSEITLHCPNTGSMRNCAEPGSRVWYSDSGNAARKYPCTWELVEVEGRYRVGINTGRANALVREALGRGAISELQGYRCCRAEVPYGSENSRIDFLLSDKPGAAGRNWLPLPVGSALIIIVAVLLLRPNGLFGKNVVARV